MVERLFLAVPGGCLQFVIVVFPDHTHLLFLSSICIYGLIQIFLCLSHLEDSDYHRVEVSEKLHVNLTLPVIVHFYNIVEGAFEKDVMCILNTATATEWGFSKKNSSQTDHD